MVSGFFVSFFRAGVNLELRRVKNFFKDIPIAF